VKVSDSQQGRTDRRPFEICAVSQLGPGQRVIREVPGVGRVGIFNVDGKYYALKSVCPHHGASLCEGPITGTTRAVFGKAGPPKTEWVRDGEIVRCPWHGWEFDITTGKALVGFRWRVAQYDVVLGPSGDGGAPISAPSVGLADGEPDPPSEVSTFPVVAEDGTLWLVI
jgi:nitrite reductase/ring-hydroxylating ferredoxin subunit